ncbi:hypothetical protein MRX96_002979 [Rhipicephalus microplus]
MLRVPCGRSSREEPDARLLRDEHVQGHDDDQGARLATPVQPSPHTVAFHRCWPALSAPHVSWTPAWLGSRCHTSGNRCFYSTSSTSIELWMGLPSSPSGVRGLTHVSDFYSTRSTPSYVVNSAHGIAPWPHFVKDCHFPFVSSSQEYARNASLQLVPLLRKPPPEWARI